MRDKKVSIVPITEIGWAIKTNCGFICIDKDGNWWLGGNKDDKSILEVIADCLPPCEKCGGKLKIKGKKEGNKFILGAECVKCGYFQ
jgi:hypothetical protein